MNFCSVPYEADYGMYADSKMKTVPQYPMNMNPGQGQAQPMQPLNPPQMNLQMQMPQMASYPMQSMPMMSGGSNGGMSPMSTMSTQLPIGAMAPLNSMTMMPMMGNSMGGIDAPGINAVVPDLQPMSGMGQMQQYGQSGDSGQMHNGRLTGGASPYQSSPSHGGQMMANNGGGMWQYSQPMQQQQPQYQQAPQYQQQQHHAQQQHGQQQQGQRMKSVYDMSPAAGMTYRDVRNGLNAPSMHDSPKSSKGNNSFNCGKSVNKVPHWR